MGHVCDLHDKTNNSACKSEIKRTISLSDRYDNDNKFIKERRFEVILTSFSSSNDYRPLLNYNSVYK